MLSSRGRGLGRGGGCWERKLEFQNTYACMYLEQVISEFISDWWVHCVYAHGPSTLYVCFHVLCILMQIYGARSCSFRFRSKKRDPVPMTFHKFSFPWKLVCVITGYVLKNEKC